MSYMFKVIPATNGVLIEVGCWKLVYSVNDYKALKEDFNLWILDQEQAKKQVKERWKIEEDIPGQAREGVGRLDRAVAYEEDANNFWDNPQKYMRDVIREELGRRND